jgi:hypothetical protein
MALNGPSAFLAGLGARSVSSVVHNRDLAWYLEYGLWAVLAVGQWHGYVRLAGWSRQHRRLRFSLGLVGVMLVLVGLAWFTRTTFASTCTGDFVGYCDPYFWPVRAACLACTGFIIGGIATHTAVAADNPAAGTSV